MIISPGLLLAFSVEIAAYFLVCMTAWDVSIGPLPLGRIAVAVVVVYLFVRILIVAVELIMAKISRKQTLDDRKVGFFRALQIFIKESLASLLLSSFFFLFSKSLVPIRRSNITTSKQPPILLIHGYALSARVWTPIVRYLSRRGLTNIFTINLTSRSGDIDDYAKEVADIVNRICDSTRSDKVILVGFSMGGLVARAYLARYGGEDRVSRVISIGTPHHGTRIANFIFGKSASQMRIGSNWLSALNADENRPTQVKYVSIYSTHDNIVIPYTSAEFGKASNLRLIGKGHFSMLFSKDVAQLVYREISEAVHAVYSEKRINVKAS